MKYVILRDDDTNALTPVEHLERLYRPFLDRGLPVNLATIPNVRTDITYGDGILEGFLVSRNGCKADNAPIGSNTKLVDYLKANPDFRILQHGFTHEFVDRQCEFEQDDRADISRRFDEGARLLMEAGFGRPMTFVAPYDRFTRTSFLEAARRFRVLSTGWFELGRLPVSWWPRYALKKFSMRPHWRTGSTALLSHPGCHLSRHRPLISMLDAVRTSIDSQSLTVLVTHWWEFFPENNPAQAFIDVLHETAEYLDARRDVRVVAFDDVAEGGIPL